MGTDSEESQKLHDSAPFVRTAPHCGHILFTGSFCAADALTPVKEETIKHSTDIQELNRKWSAETRKRYRSGRVRTRIAARAFPGSRRSACREPRPRNRRNWRAHFPTTSGTWAPFEKSRTAPHPGTNSRSARPAIPGDPRDAQGTTEATASPS